METGRKAHTVREVAQILGLGLNSTYAAISRGEIPAIRVGRRWLVPYQALERQLSGDGVERDRKSALPA